MTSLKKLQKAAQRVHLHGLSFSGWQLAMNAIHAAKVRIEKKTA